MVTLLRLGRQQATTRRLFCFPYAGGGVSVYSQWWRTLPADIEVLGVQLPGRESRMAEPPLTSIAGMVAAALPVITGKTDQPYAFFGHSMGGLLAFEITSAMQRLGGVRTPEATFISARRAPEVREPSPPLHRLPDDGLIAAVSARYGGMSDDVLREPELMALLLPTLRADVQAVETYEPSASAPLQSALHVFGGTRDRHPEPDELHGWQRWVSAPLHIEMFEGDHFYIGAQRQAVTETIARLWPA